MILNIIISLLILVSIPYSEPQKTIAVLEVKGLNINPNQIRVAEQSLRFELQRTSLFRVLTAEEVLERFQANGDEQSSSCVTSLCYRFAASTLKADLILVAQLFQKTDRVHCQLILRDGASGNTIESVQLSVPDTSAYNLSKLTRISVADLFGTETQIDRERLQIRTDQDPISASYSFWGGGTLALLTGFAGLSYFLADGFLSQDNNNRHSGFRYVDTSYALSGLPGFFASPTPNARSRAISNAGVALSGDRGRGLANPAGLCGIYQHEASFSTAKLPAQSGSQFQASWSGPFRTGTWWSQSASMNGDELAKEMVFASAFAWDFALLSTWMTGIQGGVNVKGLLLQVGQGGDGLARSTGSGLGASLDYGMQWQIWNGPRVGLLIQDLFSWLKYSNTLTNRQYHEDLPSTLTIGTSYESAWNTILALDLRKSVMVDQKDHLLLGIEQPIFEFLDLRAGLYQVLDTDIRMWSLGAGISATHDNLRFQIHVAYESGTAPYDLMAGSEIFSLALLF